MADLKTLDSRLYPWAKWLYDYGKYYDGRLVVTSAYRSYAAQKRLHDKWLYDRGPSSLPAAAPGRSLHQYRLAFDLARLGVPSREDPVLVQLGHLWSHVGGLWGGPKDPVHFSVRV